MYRLFVIVFLLITTASFAQSQINQTDAQGRKQGAWVKKTVDGQLVYQGTFKDDKPIGEMKRFHPNGQVSAILRFLEGSDEADAQLFDEKGKLMARGKYDGQKKTGEWNYISDGKVVSTENYTDGLKHGISRRFYKSGELLEETNWTKGLMTGVYKSYFQDGKPYMECFYADGKRNGSFKAWSPVGTIQLDATYTNDTKDKDWNYYDRAGKHLFTLKYKLGQLLNPEVQDSLDKLNSDRYKPQNVPDPEKFMQNPEEYMLLMQRQGQ